TTPYRCILLISIRLRGRWRGCRGSACRAEGSAASCRWDYKCSDRPLERRGCCNWLTRLSRRAGLRFSVLLIESGSAFDPANRGETCAGAEELFSRCRRDSPKTMEPQTKSRGVVRRGTGGPSGYGGARRGGRSRSHDSENSKRDSLPKTASPASLASGGAADPAEDADAFGPWPPRTQGRDAGGVASCTRAHAVFPGRNTTAGFERLPLGACLSGDAECL